MSRFDAKAQALVIDGAVEFLGNLDNAELLRWMAACDCLLNTSREDNTPISILEALAHGVPVVSTAAGGIPDLVADGQSALLAPVGDADAVAEAVCKVLRDKELRARIVSGGMMSPSVTLGQSCASSLEPSTQSCQKRLACSPV